MLLLTAVPFYSIGDEHQNVNDHENIFLPDSLVRAQLEIADSLSLLNTMKADSILTGLFEHNIQNRELWEKAVDLKCLTMINLSHSVESIDFLKTIISNGNINPKYYYELARSYVANMEYSKAISNLQEAILIYTREKDWVRVVDKVNYLIEIYGEIEMFDEAGEYFKENIELCNRLNYNDGLLRAYKEYGESLVFENPDFALELLLEAKMIAESLDERGYCSIASYLIRFYINTNNNQSAKSYVNEYFRQSCIISKLHDSNIFTLMAHIYSLENNVDSTIYFNNKALEARFQIGNKRAIANSYLNLSGNYLIKGEIETANEYLNKAEKAVFESNNSLMLLTYYRGKVKYFEYIQDYINAHLYSQKEIKLSRELADLQYQSTLSKLNTSFEIQQKNILLEKELEERKAASRLLYFILSILLLLSSGVYFFFLIKKKNFTYLKLASKASSIEKKLSISDKERLKFQSVFEYSVTGILILDKKGLIQYGNLKSRELIGENDDAHILQIPFADFFENDFKIRVQDTLLNVFKGHKADKGFKVQIINQKNFHWLDISFAPLFFEHGNDNILVSLIDVTQEVINIEKEQEQKKELQTLLNSVTESILFIQRNGKIKALNITAANRLDSNPEDLIGLDYFDTLPKSIRKKRTEMFDNIILSKKPLIEMEMEGNYNNLVSMYPNINTDGEVDYISEFVQDITERRVAEEQIDNLKQRILRSQMNPHFIFNSLTSIQSFVIRNDADMASKYLNSFARLIRLILESSRHDFISLKSEIDILNYYLNIQKMRFSDNFSFSFEIDPELDTDRIKIPPMLAQPFIENSIEHGIQHLDEIGELKIKFVKDGTRLMIELRDNGIGRIASHNLNKENIFTANSLSTQIINDRINAINKYSKEGISYNIIDLKDEFNQAKGTQVIISIPIDNF